MAATTAGTTLTAAHQRAQARIAAEMVSLILASWRVVDPARLNQTIMDWLRITVPLVSLQQRKSADLAAAYLTRFRALELGAGAAPVAPIVAGAVVPQQVATSLLVTGPVELRRLMVTMTLEQALDRARAGSAASAMRHALNGGRDTIIDSVNGDERAIGYARVTSGKACAFCAMLASRGPVYKSKESALTVVGQAGRTRGTRPMGARVHDHCRCGFEAIYRRDADWPPNSRQYQTLWNEATKGYGGKDAINAFRRAYERPALT